MAAKKGSGGGAAAESPLAFEPAMERLEEVAEELESGELSLEDSLKHYEEGMKLSRQLTKMLDHAEKRIEKLKAGEDGEPETEPLDLDLKPGEPGEGQLPF